ncbi:acetyl-CoA C-acyltransferase [Chitinophaga pendula]|uniref:acetyl-CoA C-acyltransferase n=1 Tax=Chitinophaga TaxID=79328 RepID=UPI000BAECBE2|nr:MULTISPECIES: acetyl-CoA C-acyltransferase [Chitinophaga]ASZ13313.1 acetyl-CoA C-acyltransferase [Chitinophaga sp. MD30]UCJ09062.1 acetyl-CoA C-acyltransferase [Chitinophaga pendula]
MKDVFIVAAFRTPTGGYLGSLSGIAAPQLATYPIQHSYQHCNISPEHIDAVYFGNVLSAGVGQSPARQAAILSKIPVTTDATTINKVCASGMKATMLGAQQIQLGLGQLVLTGGMESMSNVPHYSYFRKGHKYGDVTSMDGVLKDGLTDAYDQAHMGVSAELCARTYQLSREVQDAYALASYERAIAATKRGKFSQEIVPVPVVQKKETILVSEDEDIYKVIPEKVGQLPPVFVPGGTVTAANASNLNDGAAALLLASAGSVAKYGLQPIARILSYADAAQAPEWFTTAPSQAIPKALELAGLRGDQIDYYEINEAYAAVALANQQLLGIPADKLNVYGGAVAIGHPLGASGARILVTLTSVLRQEGGRYGVAAICNGGGGASAIVIESLV